jgi:hypothetical protein
VFCEALRTVGERLSRSTTPLLSKSINFLATRASQGRIPLSM